VVVVTAAIASILGAVFLEVPIDRRLYANDFVPAVVYLATVLGLLYAISRGPLRVTFTALLRKFGPTTNVTDDVDKLSLVVCLIFYFFLAGEADRPRQARAVTRRRRVRRVTVRPAAGFLGGRGADIVAVQAESFFDARRLHAAIPRDLLTQFDRCSAEACYSGRLAVPARGAYTMRTEFAFLSGLPNSALGYHRFNPYLQLCKQPVWTLAQQLRGLGYRTVCIHPFHADFFDRRQVMPNLGFETFLDIQSFSDAPRFGPYVSDMAVAERICEVIGESNDRPYFIFAITMENHGRWEDGRLDAYDIDPRIEHAPLGSQQLGLYLRHLCNTDRLIARITGELKSRSTDGVFCLYGDHLPSLPDAFRNARFEDERTDYLIWRKGTVPPQRFDTSAEVLGRLLLHAAFTGAGEFPQPMIKSAE
jgi:hypothetical protein